MSFGTQLFIIASLLVLPMLLKMVYLRYNLDSAQRGLLTMTQTKELELDQQNYRQGSQMVSVRQMWIHNTTAVYISEPVHCINECKLTKSQVDSLVTADFVMVKNKTAVCIHPLFSSSSSASSFCLSEEKIWRMSKHGTMQEFSLERKKEKVEIKDREKKLVTKVDIPSNSAMRLAKETKDDVVMISPFKNLDRTALRPSEGKVLNTGFSNGMFYELRGRSAENTPTMETLSQIYPIIFFDAHSDPNKSKPNSNKKMDLIELLIEIIVAIFQALAG